MMDYNPALDLLLSREWSGYDDTCPACNGIKPTIHDTGGEGHEHGCELASAIQNFSGRVVYIQPYEPPTMSYSE